MWSDFETETVAGRYQLGKLVRSEGRYGWFETSFKEQPAVISLIESLTDQEELLERLHIVEKIHHPNIAAILETGTTALQDTPLVYAVMEYTEENLEDVLRERALSVDETRQVAESLVSALSAIHKNQLVFGRGYGEMEPSSVLAAGDTIKLRSDRLQGNRASQTGDLEPPYSDAVFESLKTKDVQALGVLLYRCLTLRSPKLDGNDPSIQLLPQPFVQVVRRALSGQATTDEIGALLGFSSPVVQVDGNVRDVGDSVRDGFRDGIQDSVQRDAVQDDLPGQKELSLLSMRPRRVENVEENPGGSTGNLPWIVAGIILLLLITGFVLRAVLHSSPSAPQTPPAPVAATKSAPTTVPPPTAAHPNAARTSLPAQPASKPVVTPPAQPISTPITSSSAQPLGKNALWRVVAFTYNHQDQAEHKARTIADKYPDLQAQVFSPKGNHAPYLVTLGGPMERDAAFKLLDKAVREGLPHDTYAQNYSH